MCWDEPAVTHDAPQEMSFPCKVLGDMSVANVSCVNLEEQTKAMAGAGEGMVRGGGQVGDDLEQQLWGDG